MSGVFQRECSCDSCPALAKVEHCKTDALAVSRAWAHWQRRIGAEADHRYWSVHGPSGHVIALRDTPVGTLPPPPEPLSALG